MDFKELKKMPIAEFCLERLGYTPNKGHDSRLWRSLKSPEGLTIITKSTPGANGHFLFSCTQLGLGGTIIDLLLKVHSKTMEEVREILSTQKFPSIPPPPLPPSQDSDNTRIVKERLDRSPNYLHSPPSNYLTNRGLSLSTMEFFDVGGSEKEVLFPLYRRRKGKWVAQTSISYTFDQDGKRVRYFQKGLQRKGSYSILKNKHKKITDFKEAFVFESPIDALSFFQIFKREGLYVSTCGTLTSDLLSNLPLDLNSLDIKHVVVGMDNDDSGARMAVQMARALREKKIQVTLKSPLKKDWNDDLLSGIYDSLIKK